MNNDLKCMTEEQLVDLVASLGGQKFHAKYIFSFIHSKLVESIEEITTISKALRQKLIDQDFFISNLTVVERFSDPDGTVKYLFETPAGDRFESVYLQDDDRKTLCISCQSGCKMNCCFCATAKIKFKADLSVGEILDQVYKVTKDLGSIDNVVYMGMGEPFDNYDNVSASAHILNSKDGLNIGARHITVSTCGMVDKIEAFAHEQQQFRLAVSLHAGTNAVRERLMPINRKWSIEDVIDAVKVYQTITHRRVTFEYCMIKDVNDSLEQAKQLVRAIRGVKCNVNLIEYNPSPECSFQASSHDQILAFKNYLADHGFETHVRFKRGQTIKAACGQLGADWLEKK